MKQTFPQRFDVTPPPGTLFKRAHDLRTRQLAEQAAQHNPVYLNLIRQCPCLKCGMDPCGEAAHVRRQSAAHGKRGGIGKKPADKWALPLCAGCHRRDKDAQHQIGEDLFWHILGIDPLFACERLYAARSTIIQIRATAFCIIAERKR